MSAPRRRKGKQPERRRPVTVYLPCPPPYKDIHCEAMMCLDPQDCFFEGLRFGFTKAMFKRNNQNRFLHHRVTFGVSTANYEYGSTFINRPNFLLTASVMTDGIFNATVKHNLSRNIILNTNVQLMDEPDMSHGMVSLDYKGPDFRSQIHMGNGALFGANHIQSITPHFSFGGEVFWDGEGRGVSYGARFNTEKMVFTGQVASTGMLALNYAVKVSQEVLLASNCTYDCLTNDFTARVGSDWVCGQRRMRGKLDTNGSCALSMEQRSSMGLKFILSGEINENKKCKFGMGLSVGE